jgi:hypothetical protein
MSVMQAILLSIVFIFTVIIVFLLLKIGMLSKKISKDYEKRTVALAESFDQRIIALEKVVELIIDNHRQIEAEKSLTDKKRRTIFDPPETSCEVK